MTERKYTRTIEGTKSQLVTLYYALDRVARHFDEALTTEENEAASPVTKQAWKDNAAFLRYVKAQIRI